MIANKNYQAGLSVLGIRSGRSRYAPEIEQGNIKAAIDQGIQKIQYLDAQSAKSISEMRMAMLDKDYERATKAYAVYSDLLDRKSKSIFDLHDLALKDQQLKLDQYNSTHTANAKDYEYYISKDGKKSFYDWTNAKTGSTDQPSVITTETANSLGLPESLVGLTSSQFASDLQSDTPPAWFRPYIQEQIGQPLTDEGLATQWSAFKTSPTVTEFNALQSSGGDSSSGSSSEFDSGGLPPPVTD